MSASEKTQSQKELERSIMETLSVMERQIRLNRYENLNHLIKKHQILFTGSSLMEHFPIEELRMSMNVDPIIYNRGIGGFTTEDFLNHIDVMLLQPEASKVFINIGTNDISERFGENGAWLPRLIQNYDQILSILKKEQPDCDVYVMAYYPANLNVTLQFDWGASAFGTRTPENMALVNQAVSELAEKYRYHFINVNEGLTDKNGDLKAEYTTDGVHMIPEAYAVILKNLLPYL